jgi:predicted DNA-binding transcriptional regulator AlpA
MMARSKSQISPSQELMRRSEVADTLGVSVRTLENWGRDGLGPAFRRIGREAYYLRSDLDAWILAQPAFGEVQSPSAQGKGAGK